MKGSVNRDYLVHFTIAQLFWHFGAQGVALGQQEAAKMARMVAAMVSLMVCMVLVGCFELINVSLRLAS